MKFLTRDENYLMKFLTRDVNYLMNFLTRYVNYLMKFLTCVGISNLTTIFDSYIELES